MAYTYETAYLFNPFPTPHYNVYTYERAYLINPFPVPHHNVLKGRITVAYEYETAYLVNSFPMPHHNEVLSFGDRAFTRALGLIRVLNLCVGLTRCLHLNT